MEKKFFVDEVVMELNERGYSAESKEVMKNGVAYTGVTIGDGTVKPNIYIDSFYDKGVSVRDTAEKVIEIAESHKLSDDVADHVTSFLNDKDFCLENVKIVCSKANTYQDYINRQENGITLTMVIDLSKADTERMTCRVAPQLLSLIGVSEEELWERAKANTEKDVEVKGMFDTLKEMMGYDPSIMDESEDDKMLVVSNHSKCNGAYAVFTDTAKAEIKKRMNVDEVIVIPSSIHECIVVPRTEEMSMDAIAQMIMEVNTNEVAEEDILSDSPIAMAI